MSATAPGRPRILQVGPDMRGGMTEMIRGLLGSPLAERYEMEMVATHRGPDPPVRRLVIFAAALWRISSWALRGRGRIVHIHVTVRGSMYRKAVCVVLARLLRRRVVLHVHSGPGDIASFRRRLGWPSAALFGVVLRRTDTLLAVSTASAAALADAFSVELPAVVPNAAPASPGEKEVTADGPPLVAYIGGFENPVKGGAEMLAALRDPRLEGACVALAGPGELPPEGESLVESGEVEWRGWIEADRRDALMRRAEIFVLPSTSEGMPIALLEAMAGGLAIVATTVGGVPEILDDDVDALLVPPGDVPALATAVHRLIDDATLRRRLGRAAIERARRLNADEVTAPLDRIYRSLLGTG